MSVDLSGNWGAKPASDPFLPGIEGGMWALGIDHIDPLLQVRVTASAPGYALGSFVLNYRTDRSEVLTKVGGMQVRTVAFWRSGDELVVDTSMRLGSVYKREFQSSWRFSALGETLSVRHLKGEFAGRVTMFRQLQGL
jgi:hypothetical protein